VSTVALKGHIWHHDLVSFSQIVCQEIEYDVDVGDDVGSRRVDQRVVSMRFSSPE